MLRAREAADALAEEATAVGDTAALELAEEDNTTVGKVEVALGDVRKVLSSAENQKRPSEADVTSVEEAGAFLQDSVQNLEDVTALVEETTIELQSNLSEMNLAQIV